METETVTATVVAEITTEDLLRKLAQVRLDLFDQSDTIKSLIDSVKSTPAYQNAEKLRAAYEAEEKALYEEICRRAVEAFDGENKKPWPGVGIQEKTVAQCLDLDAARQYALTSLPGALTLNMTEINKLAVKLAGTPYALPFYKVEKKPQATVAANLSSWLPEPEQPEVV